MNVNAIQILLAEDSEDDIVLIQEALEEAQLINLLQVVKDGEEALEYLHRKGRYKDAKLPGLVLLDINMPRKGGFEVLQEIKSDPSLNHIPVCMLTVSDRDEEVIKAYKQGACSFIRKPVNFNDFKSVVKQFTLYWALVASIPGHKN